MLKFFKYLTKERSKIIYYDFLQNSIFRKRKKLKLRRKIFHKKQPSALKADNEYNRKS